MNIFCQIFQLFTHERFKSMLDWRPAIMATALEAPPVLSTPDSHILELTADTSVRPENASSSDDELRVTYEIDRTLREIRERKWKRIALQFPDDMLRDAPRVFQLLSRGLMDQHGSMPKDIKNTDIPESEKCTDGSKGAENAPRGQDDHVAPKLYILADTSYGTCCVDEVAAEHVNADGVVHYGRACLSPTARLAVVHVFTHKELDHASVVAAFKNSYPDRNERVVIVSDVVFADHVDRIASRLRDEGYVNVYATSVVHNPSSPIPNRTVPQSVQQEPDSLKEWQLFHISDPPTALLLTLSSRVDTIRIYPTAPGSSPSESILASTAAALRRRYAVLTSLNTAPVFGILINTLSVKNYLHIVEHVQKRIAEAGKKSYMFVVGKLNAAKVANFSEIGGWVIIGCWESSLVDSQDFWKPVITPYELELALQSDAERVWTGQWSSDYQDVLDRPQPEEQKSRNDDQANGQERDDGDFSEPESAPPEFDLRTGRYITASTSRPMRLRYTDSDSQARPGGASGSRALTKRAAGDVATIAGVVSPAAEYLRTQRTWGGLGSDFTIEYETDGSGERGSSVVEGRSGIARGYTAGDNLDRR
jgi:diphthamide biosynthesis protein 2